jgi:hypothetical protein
MSDKGVTFAGNGGQDAGSGEMKSERSPGLQAGGPVQFPKGMEDGFTASGDIVNKVGPDNVSGGGVKFTKGNDW